MWKHRRWHEDGDVRWSDHGARQRLRETCHTGAWTGLEIPKGEVETGGLGEVGSV